MADGAARPDWLTPDYPEWREHPPWVMSDMVLAERVLPAAILGHPAAERVAAEVSAALRAGAGVVVTGCGTSEHAARAVAELISEALGERSAGRVAAAQAFEAALAPRSGLCIGVSHEGSTAATVAALAAARQAGARTCLITAAASSLAGEAADVVFPTPLRDASWCHTVGYLSPLLAGAAVAGVLAGRVPDGEALSGHLAACDGALERLAGALGAFAGAERLLVVGSGLDAITAAEQALKIEEGAWIPSTALPLETLLHGHLPAAGQGTGLIAFLCDPRAPARRAERTRAALRAAEAVGVAPLLLTRVDYLSELDEADARAALALPAGDRLGLPGAFLAGAAALQRVTLAFSRLRGTNPDLLRRDDVRYRTAALLGADTQRLSDSQRPDDTLG